MVITRRGTNKEPITDEGIGPYLSAIAKKIKQRMLSTDDNCTIMCFGPTGSGKTTLGYQFGNAYNDGEGLNPELVGFDKQSWALALDVMRKKKGVYGINDEANISARDSMTNYNKDVIDLLFSIRGKQMCLFMCNPSAHYLDKMLVEEGLINFFLFITKKQQEYYFFTQKGVMNLLKDHKNLKFETMKQHGPKYAVFKGWFKKYQGEDWVEYLKKKEERMENKIDLFVEKYSKGMTYTAPKAAIVIGVTIPTLLKYVKLALKAGVIKDVRNLVTGHWSYNAEHIKIMKAFIMKYKGKNDKRKDNGKHFKKK